MRRRSMYYGDFVKMTTCRLIEEGMDIEVIAWALKVEVGHIHHWQECKQDGAYKHLEVPPQVSYEQLEITRLTSELATVKAERDLFKAIVTNPRWLEQKVEVTLTKQPPFKHHVVKTPNPKGLTWTKQYLHCSILISSWSVCPFQADH